MRVLARPVGRDHTGVQAGVKAGVHAQVPIFRCSKGAVHFRGGHDAPWIAPEQHRSPQMTKERLKMHFTRNSLLTFRNLQVAKLSDFFCSTLGIKWILRKIVDGRLGSAMEDYGLIDDTQKGFSVLNANLVSCTAYWQRSPEGRQACWSSFTWTSRMPLML